MRLSRLLITVIILVLLAAMVPGCSSSPKAKFEADITIGQVPLTVTFSNNSTNADEFQWDFGDGQTATTTTTEESIEHQYTKSGTITVTLTAIKQGDPPETATATLTLTIDPDVLDAVTIPLSEVAAGETKQLEAMATDQYGNQLSDVEAVWTMVNEHIGSITQAGIFTANEVAGTFADAVEVQVTQEALVRTAEGAVTISPGPLDQVVIAPDPTEIGIGMTQQFVAVGADQYGNAIYGLAAVWSVENGGGTIDANGLFTAGDTSGTYSDTVKAEVTQDGITQQGTASVEVEADRIAFVSDRDDEQWDTYVMEIDGTNVERLTTTEAVEATLSWSPDGRRIVYDSWIWDDGILVMNDDGGWKLRLIENESESDVVFIFPAWSPDGSKIAFIRATVGATTIEDLDIFVMDVDGGNVTQLTDTPNVDEWAPTWSPDGTKIVYDHTPSSARGDIYVMNADGSNPEQLTSNSANDTSPVWSPDGTQIAFTSERGGDAEIYVMNADGTNQTPLTSNSYWDGDPSWSPDGTQIVFDSDRDERGQVEIYIMDADGSNVTRLTDNEAYDAVPCWAPRKMGVEVTEASVIVPGASRLEAMAVDEVTAQVREAVVRIETDLGSGSGFIIDPNGLIMTCNHVVRDAEEITVYLDNGTSYTGTVEARDLVRDLAIIKIEATELQYVELGDLSRVSLGQQVVVLGYPLGSENIAVTSGFVSAIEFDSGRNITWLQTDSVINPGNSGGPLLNLQGQVIGVVSTKLVGFGIEGVGFTISANTVNMYLSRLKAGETIMAFK